MSHILQAHWLKKGGMAMTRISYLLMVIIPAGLAALCGAAISAQDKYTVQVPGGLSFAEFKGYEDWETVSVSKTEHAVRCDPRQSGDDRGLSGRRSRQRQAFPRRLQDCEDPLEAERVRTLRSDDGAGHPGQRRLHRKGQQAVRRTAADGDMPRSTMTRRPTHSRLRPSRTSRRRRTTPSAGSPATR